MPDVITLLTFSAGIMSLGGLQSLIISRVADRKELLWVFSGICWVAAAYQVANIRMLTSTDLASAIVALKWQSAVAIIILPLMFLVIAIYTNKPNIRPWAIAISSWAAFFLLLNAYLPYGFRYAVIQSVTFEILASGREILLIKGEISVWAKTYYLCSFLTMVWNVYRVVVFYQAGNRVRALIFGSWCGIQIGLVVYTLLLNQGFISGVYTSGFGFTLLVILGCIDMLYYLRHKAKVLVQQADDLRVEITLRNQAEVKLHKWYQVIEQAQSAIAVFDLSGRLLLSNHAYDKYWAECLPEARGLHPIFHELHPFNRFDVEHARILSKVELVQLVPGQSLQGCVVGKEATLRCAVNPIYDHDGKIIEIVVSHTDVTAEEKVSAAIEKMASLAAPINDYSLIDNLILNLLTTFSVRGAYVAVIEHDENNELMVRTISRAIDGEVVSNESYPIAGNPSEVILTKGSTEFLRDVQRYFPHSESLKKYDIESYFGSAIYSSEGKLLGILSMVSTEPMSMPDNYKHIFNIFLSRAGAELQRLEMEEQIHRMAFEDYLTRLPNRAQTHKLLRDLIQRSKEDGEVALLLIDLDHFKTINDGLGHDIGDEVIRKIGERLREHLPNSHIVTRMGGDEFLVMWQGQRVNLVQIETLANELLSSFSQPVQVGERIISVSASMGGVLYPHNDAASKSHLDLLRFADMALYQAKSAGRNHFVMFDPIMLSAVSERLEIERGLRLAMEEKQLQIYVQPQVDCKGQPLGAEVLLRWQHPEKGFISPARFIPVAEESGLILKLGNWVLDQSLAYIKIWRGTGFHFPGRLSINISAWQFAQQYFVEDFKNKLRSSGVSPELITLELTESALLTDLKTTRDKLQALRQLGCKVVLDDFGTGYSSLSYLRQLPMDGFKIDKSFVDEIRGSQIQPLVESMLAIARHMHFDVVAEGVEQEQQYKALVTMGCEVFQGFLFARPMPADEFPAWCRNTVPNFM